MCRERPSPRLAPVSPCSVFTDAVHDIVSLFRGQRLPGPEDPNASLFLQGWSVSPRAHGDRFPLEGDLECVAGNKVQCVTEELGQDETPRFVERGFHECQYMMDNTICQMVTWHRRGERRPRQWDFQRRKGQWGRMDRSGFKKQAPPERAEAPASR